MSCSKDAEQIVGKPVVIIDMATGRMIEGIVSGATEVGMNKLCHVSINVDQKADGSALHTNYSRINNVVKINIETKLNADAF